MKSNRKQEYETITNSRHFQNTSNGLALNKINGIYSRSAYVVVDAEFMRVETIAGVDIYSKTNGFVQFINKDILDSEMSYNEMIDRINSNSGLCRMLFTYTNENEDWQKDCFKENGPYKAWGDLGYAVSFVKSFVANGDTEHPACIIQTVKESTNLYLYQYDEDLAQYVGKSIKKICPEFWAQKEAEQAEEQNNLESTSNNVALMNSSEDHNDVNYASKFKKFLPESADHETEAEVLTKNKTNPSFDPLFSFEL